MLQGCLMSGIVLLFKWIKSLITGKPVEWSKKLKANQDTTIAEQHAEHADSSIVRDVYATSLSIMFDGQKIKYRDITDAVQLGFDKDKKKPILLVTCSDGKKYMLIATNKAYSNINFASRVRKE